ncbi:MAG: hypothetical protein CMJ49_05115, partial [Planctomycetaceae bacterium]|nr:hypothetical protein [Planctomycetaceae bacterium]
PRLTLTAASGLPHFIVVSGIDDVPDDPFVAPPLPPVFPAAPDTEGDYRIRIALDEPNPVFTPVTVPNIVDPTLDAFAITTGAVNFPTYAYDSDDRINGLLFTNPGVIPTLGTVDASPISPTFGQFSQLLGLTQNAMGTPLSSDAVAVTVDPGTGDVFIATADDRLLQFDAVDGTFVHDYGPVTNDQGDRLDLNTLVVNPDPPIKPGTVEFISMDRRFGQIIEIVIDPPAPFPVDATGDTTEIEVVRARTEPGTVETQVLNDLAFDPATGTWHAIREGAPDQLVIFRDPDANSEIDENDPAFIHFDSITTANFTGAFAGRIETGGNTIRTVRVQADPLSPGDMFTGQLISNTGITSFTQSGIDFDGTLRARTGIRSVTLNGADVGTEGVFAAGRSVTTFRGSGAFAGLFDAHGVQSFSNAGLVTADAILNVDNQARTLIFGAGFEGQATIGATTSLRMAGSLDNGGSLQFDRNATTVTLSGGVGPDGSLHVLGSGRSLSVGTGHEGSIAYRGDLTTANISSLTRSLLSVGGSTRSVSVAGITIDSLLSFGTWIGPDGIYNTADDVIFGGSAGTLSFRDDYQDSAVVAGVLPRMDVATLANTPNLPADMRAFTGNAGALNILDVDAADAGGIRSSHIGRVTMSRNVLNSESVFGGTAGRQAIVAAADGHINLFGNEIDRVHTREYVDRFGAPQVIGGVSASTNTVQVLLNEEINTSSLTVSQDGNGDGDLDDLVDFQGSVTVTANDTGLILNDIALLYSRDIDTTGFPVPFHQGVLTIVDTSGSAFGGSVVNVTLSGAFGGDAVTDRTGTRSALRDFDQDGIQEFQEDPFGSTLDGNADGLEDGDRSLAFLLDDAPDFFEDALATTQVILPDDQLVSLVTTFDAGTFFNPDIDIFRIDNDTPGQFFGMQYIGSSDAQIAVFRLDDQGTTTSADNDLLDDTFEIVSSHEATAYSSAFEQNAAFQAVELTEVGTYFALVAAESSFFSDLSPTGGYTINLALATTDQALVDAFGSFWVDKDDEVIGYASDFVSQHHDAGDLLVDLDTYVGLAATPADDLFAVVDDTGGSGAFQLHQINVDTNLSVTAFPDLIGDIEIGGAYITDISDLAVDPFTGDLYVAGIDPAAPAEQRLFTVDPTSGAATVVGRLWDVAGAAVLGDPLDGLAFRADGMLYGIRDIGAAENVVQIDLTPTDLDASPGAPEELAVTDLGAVQIIDPFTGAPEDSDTNAAAFDLNNQLVILDSSQGFGQARRAVVDLVTPGASTVLTPAGSETDTTTTLVYRFGTDQSITIDTHGAGTNDQLLVSRNLLGANVPKQLVYLNFDGGTSTKIDFLGPTVLQPLDAGVLDPGLAPFTDTLINGSANVTGIVQNIVDIFVNIPASTINPETGAVVTANPLNSREIGAAELTALAGDINRLDDGLAFTTVDPVTFGLDPDIDFTTMFVGDSDSPHSSSLDGIASTVDHMNSSDGDEAVIFLETFSRLTLAVDIDTRLNEYSRALANVIAHEFGHTLGLNHTGSLSFSFTDPDTGEVFEFGDFNDLYPNTDHPFPDDPDNDPATPDDSNTGTSLIGSARPDEEIESLWELGTANLTAGEFPVGDNDQVDQLLRFLT